MGPGDDDAVDHDFTVTVSRASKYHGRNKTLPDLQETEGEAWVAKQIHGSRLIFALRADREPASIVRPEQRNRDRSLLFMVGERPIEPDGFPRQCSSNLDHLDREQARSEQLSP